MDYYYTNQPQASYGKKFDVKGLIFTLACLIFSLITALSPLMPLISMGNGSNIVNINMIDTCKLIAEIAKLTPSNIKVLQIVVLFIIIFALLLPVIISLFGIIFTVSSVVKLIRGKYSANVNGVAKTILIMEMIFAVSLYPIAIGAAEFYDISFKKKQDISLALGWYLPVILAVCLMVIGHICNIVKVIKKSEDKKKSTLVGVFSIVGVIFSSLIYVALCGSQYVVMGRRYDVYVPFSYINIMLVDKGFDEVFLIIITLLIIVIAIMSYICFSRNLKLITKLKFSAVLCIATGICAVLFTIVNYILFNIYVDSDVDFNLGSAGYIYIIMGSLLIVLGVAYMCIRTVWSNTAKPMHSQYQNNTADNQTIILPNQQGQQYYQDIQNRGYNQNNMQE